jgi:glycerol uptake facilitator-like aquaporin
MARRTGGSSLARDAVVRLHRRGAASSDLHHGSMAMQFKECAGEGIGTFWLTSAGCGSGVLAATFPQVGIGLLGVSLAFGLTLIYLISILVTNPSVSPARSMGLGLFAGAWAIDQLWLFRVALRLGAAVDGYLYRWLTEEVAPDVTGIRRELRSV